MTAIRRSHRATLLAALAAGALASGAFAALGSAPADAYTQIYGSGAALQSQLQTNILIPDSGLGDVTYTVTTAGKGFEEFGNTTGVFGYNDTGIPNTELDAYVAVDSSPTTAEFANAQAAAGSTATNEIAVPVAQTPLDLLLSLPSGITLNPSQNVDLTATLASELYAGTVPSNGTAPGGGSYPLNTWGAFLTDAGLTETSNASPGPGLGEFYDSGTSGGSTKIEVETRKNGAGTTLNLKQYLIYVDNEPGTTTTEWKNIEEDANAYDDVSGSGDDEWPTTATIKSIPPSNNNTDVNEVEAVDGTPGTIGYATSADAAGGTTVPFTSTPKLSTDKPSSTGTASASHQILYALLQDNYVPGTPAARSHPVFADPEANSTSTGTPASSGVANIYTGSNIQVNGTNTGGVGSWVVPESPGFTTFNDLGTWTGTRASDPDVYDDSGEFVAYYPLVAVAFDLSWSNFSVGNLATLNYTSDAQATTQKFLEFATSPTGQGDIAGHYFFAPLPANAGNSSLANIQAVAQSAAGGV